MITIPTIEIKKPELHADTLGYTFVWNGHFLRGIYPESVEWAMGYFESGFVNDVVQKGLMPKTWISDFENEQFGLIIEHEIISPVLFATEWNSAMLKDAALMVLEIAEIGWKYGYNMVDSHKMNVLFNHNRPLYVDLGSFVPKEDGCTGWSPYYNFLESYTYILELWTNGCNQLAKRMMSPGVTFHTEDYLAWKYPIFRHLRRLLSFYIKCTQSLNRIASVGNDHVRDNMVLATVKRIINFIKPLSSQRFSRIRKRVSRIKIDTCNKSSDRKDFDLSFMKAHTSMTCINISNELIISKLYEMGCSLISLNEDNRVSNSEFNNIKGITSISYPLLNGNIVVRGKDPECRLCSEIVLARCIVGGGHFSHHNSIVYLKRCIEYSISGRMYVLFSQLDDELFSILNESFSVIRVLKDKNLVEVTNQS